MSEQTQPIRWGDPKVVTHWYSWAYSIEDGSQLTDGWGYLGKFGACFLREHIGFFDSLDEAKAACEKHRSEKQ